MHFLTLRLAARLSCVVVGIVGGTLPAQGRPRAERTTASVESHARWTITSPDASLAWFDVLADLHMSGAGPFAFVVARDEVGVSELARSVRSSRDFEILHFVPLYYPTADRAALVRALRAAAITPAAAPVPRAELLVAALSQALAPEVRRARLPELAFALEHARPVAPAAAQLAEWQQLMDSVYAPALAPWLNAERLNGGRLIVSPDIGAEGRIFAGTSDRADNIIAVGTGVGDAAPHAPLFAYVREICFPTVTRAAQQLRDFSSADPRSARRASLAAVRCGADLLDWALPARSNAYRAFWIQAANAPSSTHFDDVFPPDPSLQPAISASLRRVVGRSIKP